MAASSCLQEQRPVPHTSVAAASTTMRHPAIVHLRYACHDRIPCAIWRLMGVLMWVIHHVLRLWLMVTGIWSRSVHIRVVCRERCMMSRLTSSTLYLV